MCVGAPCVQCCKAFKYDTRFFISNSTVRLSLELLNSVFNIAQNPRGLLLQIGVQTSFPSELFHLVNSFFESTAQFSSLVFAKRRPKFQPQARKIELLVKNRVSSRRCVHSSVYTFSTLLRCDGIQIKSLPGRTLISI